MYKYKADYTNTFRSLTLGKVDGMEIFKAEEFKEWYNLWKERLSRQEEDEEASKKLMEENNPIAIPRNHRVEEALEAATENNDFTVMKSLLDAITKPYDYSNINEYYSMLPKSNGCKYKTYCGT